MQQCCFPMYCREGCKHVYYRIPAMQLRWNAFGGIRSAILDSYPSRGGKQLSWACWDKYTFQVALEVVFVVGAEHNGCISWQEGIYIFTCIYWVHVWVNTINMDMDPQFWIVLTHTAVASRRRHVLALHSALRDDQNDQKGHGGVRLRPLSATRPKTSSQWCAGCERAENMVDAKHK